MTLTVDVESNAPASVTNTATIAGGGDVETSNNTATDSTQINRGQDLTITKSHTGNFTQGQSGATYTITMTNSGAAATHRHRNPDRHGPDRTLSHRSHGHGLDLHRLGPNDRLHPRRPSGRGSELPACDRHGGCGR